jgi:hypothetical protein
MAWKGVAGDQQLFLASSSDGKNFAGLPTRPEQKSDQGPALAPLMADCSWPLKASLEINASIGRALPMASTLTVRIALQISTAVRDPC